MEEFQDYISGILTFYPAIENQYTINDWETLSSFPFVASSNISNTLVACRGIIDMSTIHISDSKDAYNIMLPTQTCADYLVQHLSTHVVIDKPAETPNSVIIRGVNLWELYDVLYKDAKVYNTIYKNLFECLLYQQGQRLKFQFKRTLPNAQAPKKNKISDSGYDLVLVQKIKQVGNVSFYDTGIQVQPPLGYYFDLVGRSSISKTGYMVANNVGIIDQSYRGNVIVALIKLDLSAPDLELPSRLVQLIPRRVIHMQPQDVGDDELGDTKRGDGGFGSSGK